jgi:hypothetical protein
MLSPKKNIRNFKNNKYKQNWFIYSLHLSSIDYIDILINLKLSGFIIEKIVERTNDSWSQPTTLSSRTHQIANKNGQLVKYWKTVQKWNYDISEIDIWLLDVCVKTYELPKTLKRPKIWVWLFLRPSTALFRTVHRTFWHRNFHRDGLAHPYT